MATTHEELDTLFDAGQYQVGSKALTRAGESVAAEVQNGATSFNDLWRLGKLLAASGFFQDARGAAQACTKVLAGAEIGFGPVASLVGIHIIKGNVSVGANLQAIQIRKHGYDYRVRELSETMCRIEFFQGPAASKDSLGISVFSIEDAKKQGLAEKDNWKKTPRNLLFARAISNGVKWYCPEVMGGTVYTEDEIEEIRERKFLPQYDAELDKGGSHVQQRAVAKEKIEEIVSQNNEREIKDALTITDDDLPPELRGKDDDAPTGPSPVFRASFDDAEWALVLPYLVEKGCDTDAGRDEFLLRWTEGKTELLAVAVVAARGRRKKG